MKKLLAPVLAGLVVAAGVASATVRNPDPPKEPTTVDCRDDITWLLCGNCRPDAPTANCCGSGPCNVICGDFYPTLDPKTNTCHK